MHELLVNPSMHAPIMHVVTISLSTVVFNSIGIGRKLYGFWTLKINLAIGFTRKNRLECIGKAVMMLYLG